MKNRWIWNGKKLSPQYAALSKALHKVPGEKEKLLNAFTVSEAGVPDKMDEALTEPLWSREEE